VNADEIQIKMAQGAKPGEGGQLPGQQGGRDRREVALFGGRVTLVSPSPHHDNLIDRDLGATDLRPEEREPEGAHRGEAGGGGGRGTVGRGVSKAHADVVLISATTAARSFAAELDQAMRGCRGSWAWRRRSRCCC